MDNLQADIQQQLAASLEEAAELRRQNESLRRELDEHLALAAHMAEHMAGERGLLRTLIDNMPDHIYVKDRNGRFIIANDAAAQGIGVTSPQALVGKSDLDFYPTDCGRRFYTDEQNILQSGQPIVDQVEENINLHGVRRWFSTTKVPFYDAAGAPRGIVGISRDITQRIEAEEQMALLATRDALTGLPNRRALMERLAQSIAMCERSGMQLAVAFIDLDRLKYVNDTFGHEAGDLMLQTVADRMGSCVRKSDTLARLGGDEFVLATLHQTPDSLSDLRGVVEGMLAKIQEVLALPLILGGEPFCITCSIGVAIHGQDGHGPDMLLKRADAAMYAAKKAGRNRVAWHSPPPDPLSPDTLPDSPPEPQ